MELLRPPDAMLRRGIKDWPKIVLVGDKEKPPIGMPYIRATKNDYVLTFRLLMPTLKEKHPYIEWNEVFYELTGRKYRTVKIDYTPPEKDYGNNQYGEGRPDLVEEKTLEELSRDVGSYVDMDILLEMQMIPKLFGDLAEVIKVNVTNEYKWMDGYNKKLGICSGYLEPQARKKSLVILDISRSIPDGLMTGMLTLIKTITDITHADLIITGAISKFYTNSQVMSLDIRKERHDIGRSNESSYFRRILKNNNMDYATVISFGDSDCPGPIELDYPIHTEQLYDFFIGYKDGYGTHYTEGTGYARWVTENCKNVKVIRNYEWAKLFRK